MDSLTQFTLGATVSAVLLGRHIGYQKAAIIGGLMGTVPDLDTFVPHDDPVEKFVAHRGPSHSLVIQALVAPVFAEPLVRLFKSLKDHRILTYLAVYLMFATHALIDAMTIYGTKLLWPIIEEPFGVGSIFIIDPLYTLPLLYVTIWAFFVRDHSPKLQRALIGAMVASTLYMGASYALQLNAAHKADTWLAEKGISPERTLTIATPFNIFYWRTIAIDDDRYLNLYTSTIGGSPTLYSHPRRSDLEGCLAGNAQFQALSAFTKGFYSINADDDKVIFSDLRMGLTPDYVFRFYIADLIGDAPQDIELAIRQTVKRGTEGDIPWLRAGILGAQTSRIAEAAARLGDLNVLTSRAPANEIPCG